jgi:molybdate transport system substrate-binding protein
MRVRSFLVVAASTILLSGVSVAAEIRVMLSGGFAAAYDELVPQFEGATGHTVITLRGASRGTGWNSIPSRLQRGEAADVVIVLGGALDDLVNDGKVVAGTRVDLGRSGIGVAVRAGSPKPDIGTVDAFKRAMLSARSVAYSSASPYLSGELFQRLGVADQVKGKSLMVAGGAVAIASAVVRGEAELGLHIISELLPVPGIEIVGPLPAEIQRTVILSAGILEGAKEPANATALIKFLASPTSAPVIMKRGLEPLAR